MTGIDEVPQVKQLCWIFFLLMTLGCSAAVSASKPLIGFVYYDNETVYLYSTAPSISEQTQVQLEYLDTDGTQHCCKSVKTDLIAAPTKAKQPVMDVADGHQVFRYVVHANMSGISAAPFLGAFVVGQNMKATSSQGGTRIRFVSSPNISAFTCFSSEGMHLFVESDGRVISHLYYGLTYDVEPTCDPKLFESQS
jgi:hypothetical protein